jgi:hypothetical protein
MEIVNVLSKTRHAYEMTNRDTNTREKSNKKGKGCFNIPPPQNAALPGAGL